MSTDPTTAADQVNWPVLTQNERRVLGVLIEKQKTTPDAYPLSINALVTGCNQKSNRDPVLSLEDVDIEEALATTQKKGLTIRVTGSSRVERWRHNLYEAWGLNKTEMAVVCELLLRGPQTEGELRGRVSRMEPLEDLDALRAVLKPLAQRKLVVYLTPEGRRGTTVTHGFHTPQELQRARDAVPAEAAATPALAPVRPTSLPTPTISLAQFEAELAAVRTSSEEARAAAKTAESRITELQAELTRTRNELAEVKEQLRLIKEGLGI
jgi:uncharacterized protein YceH (UPF0502 family)